MLWNATLVDCPIAPHPAQVVQDLIIVQGEEDGKAGWAAGIGVASSFPCFFDLFPTCFKDVCLTMFESASL